jgi:hypothetical protein
MQFITDELVPAVRLLFPADLPADGLCRLFAWRTKCLDIAWRRSDLFNMVGIFSGSLWWRTLDKDDPEYQDEQHRIMHNQIKMLISHRT